MPTDLGYKTNVRIGTSVGTMADVKIEPRVEFFEAAAVEKTVCGKQVAVGYPYCRWKYPDRRLTGEQYYQLKVLVGNAMGATVYIDTPTNDVSPVTYLPIIATYRAMMNWPEEGIVREMYNEWTMPDDGILFDRLEAV